MAFHVQFAASVEAYVSGIEGLSAEAKRRLIDRLEIELGGLAEKALAADPVAHESYRFRYKLALREGDWLYDVWVVADAEDLPSGVVRVVYIECSRHEIEW